MILVIKEEQKQSFCYHKGKVAYIRPLEFCQGGSHLIALAKWTHKHIQESSSISTYVSWTVHSTSNTRIST